MYQVAVVHKAGEARILCIKIYYVSNPFPLVYLWFSGHNGQVFIIPHTCARGKAVRLSRCRCCPQKTGIFRDLQLQTSRKWHKTVKIGEKLTYLCSYLLLTIHEYDKSWFFIHHAYSPHLLRLLSYALWLRMPRGGWKEVIKTHVQALIGPNFAESANLSSLTQRFCTSFDGNEIDISGAQNGVIWSAGHLSRVLEEWAFVDVS